MPSANSTTHSPEAPGDGTCNDESSMNAGHADAESEDAESEDAEPSTNAEGTDVTPEFPAATRFFSE